MLEKERIAMRIEVSGFRQMPQQPLHKPLVNALLPAAGSNVQPHCTSAQTRHVHKKNRQVGVLQRLRWQGGGL